MVYNSFFDEEVWEKVNQDNKDLLDDFLLELEQRQLSKNTIYQYSRDIRGIFCYICKYLDNQYVLYLNKRDFRKYSLYLTRDCGVSNARHNRLLSALKSMLNFAEESDEIYDYNRNMAEKVRGLPKEPVREIIYLTDEQIHAIVDKLMELEEYQKATLLALSYDSCARKGELAQVNKHSFYQEEKNNTNLVRGKGGKSFSLIYFDLTKRCAKSWLEQRGEDAIASLWIVGSGDNIHTASRKNLYDWFLYMRDVLANIEGEEILFNVHSLRHSALQNYSSGTHYVCREKNNGDGFPIEKLRLLANHESISTTQSYLRDNSIQELEELFQIKIDE